MNALDKQLMESLANKEKGWGKILSHLKRQFDGWATAGLIAHGYNDFKMGYMPLLANIQPEGITNNELAKKARVTKQAMSKVVKELVSLGYVETETHGEDKRSSVVFLTPKGKKLVIAARQKVSSLEQEYEKLLGKKKFTELKEMLIAIIRYEDEKSGFPCF